jgi:hypothetical protein
MEGFQDSNISKCKDSTTGKDNDNAIKASNCYDKLISPIHKGTAKPGNNGRLYNGINGIKWKW